MSNGLIIENGKVTLCGRGNGKCCPVMEKFDDFRVRITDDFGGYVILTNEQAKLIASGLNLLEENNKKLLFD